MEMSNFAAAEVTENIATFKVSVPGSFGAQHIGKYSILVNDFNACDDNTYRVAGEFTLSTTPVAGKRVISGTASARGLEVFLDLNDNRQPDVAEPRAITDRDRRFAFADAPAGRYRVRGIQQAYLAPTAPSRFVSPKLGQVVPVEVWAVGSGRVSVNVFMDINGNGKQDAADSPIAGQMVRFYQQYYPDALLRKSATDSNGTTLFEGALPVSSNLSIVAPQGMRVSGARLVEFDVRAKRDRWVSFGLTTRGLLTGRVVNDVNHDEPEGRADGSDLYGSGVTLFLDTDDDGVLDAGEVTTESDAAGVFRFNVRAGSYVVRLLDEGWLLPSAQNRFRLNVGRAGVNGLALFFIYRV